MAENLVNAGIGVDFKYTGMEQFNKLMQQINDVKKDMNDVYQGMKNINTFTDTFSRDSQSAFNKVRQSVESLNGRTTEVNKTFKQTQEVVKAVNDTPIKKVSDSLMKVTTTAHQANSSIDSVKRATDNISSSSVKRLTESTTQTTRSTNDLTDKVRALTGRVRDISGESIQRLRDKMRDLGNTTQGSGEKMHRFRDTAVGVFAGNVITNGISSIGHGLLDATKQGLQLNAAMEDIQKRWQQAGLNSSQSNAMTNQIASIRQHADISAQAITNMQKQYLTLTGSASKARDLVATITSFGKASGMTEQQQSGITRLISSNKAVNARMFQRTFGQSPEFANEIIKQTGMSKDAFNNLLQSGKLTGQQLRDAMIKASKDSSMAWSDYAKTAQGKMDLVNATINTSKVNFEKGLTASMFQQINKAAGQTGGLDKLQKKVEMISKSVGTTIGKVIGGVVSFLVKNIGPIERMASAVWNIVKGLAQGVWQTVTAPLKLIAGNAKQGSKSLNNVANALTAIGKHQTMLKVMGGLVVGLFTTVKMAQGIMFLNNTVKAYKELKTAIMATTAAKKIASVVNKALAAAQWALNAAMDANPIGIIIVAVTALVAALYELYKHFKPFRNLVNGTFKAIGKAIGGWWKQTKKNFTAVQKIIGIFAKFFQKYFGNVIKQGVKNAKQAFKVIGDVIRVFKDVFTLNFKDLGKVIPKLVGDLWKLVKGIFKEGADFVEDIGSNMWKAIWNTFKGWGKAIGNFFKDLWDGIGNTIKSGINDVIDVINAGIKGVDWVLSKVGGSGHTIGTIKHLATGTTGGRLNKDTMAMLNDGNDSPQTENKEMAILPGGRAFIPKKRNWTGILPKGTMVLNATQTRELMEMHGIQKFGLGTVVGDLWNGTKKIAGKAWNGAKSIAGDVVSGAKNVANAIAHPIKFIKSFFHGVGGVSDFVSDFTGGLAKSAMNAVVDFFKKNSDSGANNPGGSGVERWRSVAEKAAAFMGIKLSGNDIKSLLARIAKESGGNPTIVQKVDDVNSRAGHPAQGLFQYVPSTFASWAVKGHTNLQNGFDQFLAVFNDSNWRSDINMPGGWGPTGHRARRNGGPVKKNEWYQVNEAGFEMFKPKTDGTIINHSDSKKAIANAKKPINVDARMTVNINGSADDASIKKVYEAQQTQLRQLGELLKSNSGIDDGGMISL